jgi:hypothetical protein
MANRGLHLFLALFLAGMQVSARGAVAPAPRPSEPAHKCCCGSDSPSCCKGHKKSCCAKETVAGPGLWATDPCRCGSPMPLVAVNEAYTAANPQATFALDCPLVERLAEPYPRFLSVSLAPEAPPPRS